MPNVLEVGKKLVDLCRKQKNLEAIDTLYAQNIVSIEPMAHEDMPAKMEGIDKIRAKNKWWFDNHEIHGVEIMGPFPSGPWPNGDRFITHWKMDVTPTSGPFKGKRMPMEEAAMYTVKDGKIVQEEFFCDLSAFGM